MIELTRWAAWIEIALGLVSDRIQGLSSMRKDWFDGYSSWPRRTPVRFEVGGMADDVWRQSISTRLKRAALALVGTAVAFVLLIATGVWRWAWIFVAHVANLVYERYGIDLPFALALFCLGELLFCWSIAMMLKEAGERITWRGVRGFRIRDLNLGSRRMMGWLWLNRLSWMVPWLVVIAMSIGRVPWWATVAGLGEVGTTFALGIVVSLGCRLMMGKGHGQCNG